MIAALLVMILPLDWLFSAVLAAAFHELCHVMTIRILGGRIRYVRIGMGGTVIEADIPGKGKELVCALAGPSGSILLLFLCHIFPKAAICGFVQGFFNLLPVYPLDGGRILRCALELVSPQKAESLLRSVEIITYLIILLLAFIFTVKLSQGFFPLLAAILLILRAVLRKRPCKRSQIRVQ